MRVGFMRSRVKYTVIRDLIAPTQALEERRCLGILHWQLRGSGVRYWRDRHRCTCFPGPHSMNSLGSDLCSRIVYGPGPSMLFRRLGLNRGSLCNLHRGSLRGLYGHSLCT